MQTVSRTNFTTVKTEGAILPADLLQRVADGEVDGLNATDYHLGANERLNEAINRSWNRCLGVWLSFRSKRAALPVSDRGTTLTREWLLILLQELGYGRLPYHGRLPLNDDAYPISHAWEHTPIHLVSFRQDLDRRDDSIRRSPHSLVQEFLNRSDDHLWAFVSNGLRLRILRDNASLTRAAFLEFDLEALFDGEQYSDFTLLWLMAHQSRVEALPDDDGQPGTPANCWLERWSQAAAEQGTRALDALRDGVQEAISALGRGFLAARGNGELRGALKAGELDTQEYYRQLLRMVYRLIFLFVAEDRELLLLPQTDAATRQRYADFYSLGRLRRMAERRRGSPHPDLYRQLRLLMVQLRTGYAPLGLPGLGSFLFSERATPWLDGADIANRDLLEAIRALAFTLDGRVQRPVDYKNLGSEELGSVYESLLELHPQMNVDAATFTLAVAAGSERKTTGSYYTPSSLINELLNSALEPVIRDRLGDRTQINADDDADGRRSEKSAKISALSASSASHSPEQAILNIKVVDPACGSGHFLIAAAHRLANHLATIRTGDAEPGPAARRAALRDVVSKCIYGVDINEMSVELCKVALWMETLDPGKPLSFLERNIQCGNSLIGATPALLKSGIPDDAFRPITGDDKAYCREWKKRNKQERGGQTAMTFGEAPWDRLGDLASAVARMEALGDATLAAVAAQEEAYAQLVQSSSYEFGKLWADAWCAAFVWVKRGEAQGGWPYPITEQVFRNLERSPHREPGWLKAEVRRLAEEYQFFHWHLAFPQVFRGRWDADDADRALMDADERDVTGWEGGFDVVLGNPPWEMLELGEVEFFADKAPEIAMASSSRQRQAMIRQLAGSDPHLYQRFQDAKRRIFAARHFIQTSGRFPRSSVGRINLYPLFVELSVHLQADNGYSGVIVPSAISTDAYNARLFGWMIESNLLVALFDFENKYGIFPEVHRSYRFCLLTMCGTRILTSDLVFAYFCHSHADLRNPDRRITLSRPELLQFSPNTLAPPILVNATDLRLARDVYQRIGVLKDRKHERNPWQVSIQRMLSLSDKGDIFRRQTEIDHQTAMRSGQWMRLYSGKGIHQFDHRFATYNGKKWINFDAHADPHAAIATEYITRSEEVEKRTQNKQPGKWLVGYRDVCRATDERTAIATVVPLSGCDTHCRNIYSNSRPIARLAYLVGNLNSFVFDYFARQKVISTGLGSGTLEQLPVLAPQKYETQDLLTSDRWLHLRLIELLFTSFELRPFAQDCGYHGPPFRWDEERRFLLRCELDAAYFHLYGIGRDDVTYIMDTFPIVRRKDEAAHGEYRTKRVILEIYDEMAAAMASGVPYQTRLDPPPADPAAAHPWDEAVLGPYREPSEWWEEDGTLINADGDADKRRSAKISEKSASSAYDLRDGTQIDADPAQMGADQKKSAKISEESASSAYDSGDGTQIDADNNADERRSEKISEESASSTYHSLTLKSQRAEPPKPKPTAAPRLDEQPTLLTTFTPPQGTYPQRLKRTMALGQPKNQAELQELTAALADESDNIRWLAGSSLARLGGRAVVATLAAFVQSGPGATATAEARRVLTLIAQTDEDAQTQQHAQEVIDSL